jgi:hypothetical protein
MTDGINTGFGSSADGPTRQAFRRKDVFHPERNFEFTVVCHGNLPRNLASYLNEAAQKHGFKRQLVDEEPEQSVSSILSVEPWNSQRTDKAPGAYPGATGTTTFAATRWLVQTDERTRRTVAVSYVHWHFRETADFSTSIVAKLETDDPGGVAASKIRDLMEDLRRWIQGIKPTDIQKLLRRQRESTQGQ